MSFQESQARFRRQYLEHAAWKLLRADDAPYILAFVSDLFNEINEVAFGQAKVALEAELDRCREQGIWQTDTNSGAYLRQWIQSGWLRELDDLLSMTDACEVALRFCKGLEERDTNATASHLRIVQDAVRDFVVVTSTNPDERIQLLEAQKTGLQREIDDLNAGVITELSETEKRERIREIYQLASVLSGDFLRLEDEIRQLDQSLRVQMIESESGRGKILQALLTEEQLLADSEGGRAFNGFFQLLCDQNRSLEFRHQLRSILNDSAAQYLTAEQFRFLNQLMRELTRESERVFQVRRRTEESLRAFIESGAHLESRAVERLLGRLERIAVQFKDADINLRNETLLRLPSGAAKLRSPDSWQLKIPEEQLDTRDVQAQANNTAPSQSMLAHLQVIKVTEVAEQMLSCLQEHGPLTVGGILRQQPLQAGLEELVAYLRVARAVGATELQKTEDVYVQDRDGDKFKASIPGYLISAEQFPESPDELLI